MKSMKLFAFLFTFITLCLSSCVTIPKTATEFRDFMRKGYVYGAFIEQIVVDRSINAVSNTLEDKAKTCLQTMVKIGWYRGLIKPKTINDYDGFSYMVYKPTIIRSQDKIELHIQKEYAGIGSLGNLERHIEPTSLEIPEGGRFFVVVDAIAIDEGHSKVTLYSYDLSQYRPLLDAIREWVAGKNLDSNCPELSIY